MYITINDVIGEKRIYLSYPIKGKEAPEGLHSVDIAVVSMLSDNVQYSTGIYRSVAQKRQENCVE